MYTKEQVEDAIIAALLPLKTSLGVREITSYQGKLETAEDIARAVDQYPAIVVVYIGSDYSDHGARKIEAMDYFVFVGDENLRAEAEGRRGGIGNPGAYALLEGVRDLLYGKKLGLEIFPLNLLREDGVYFGGGIFIYGAEYETSQTLLYP